MLQENVLVETEGPAIHIEKVAKVVVLLIATLYLFSYLWIVWNRIAYPFELNWMEGGSVCQVQRILDGKPVYTKPSLDFVASLYGPLYYYVSAVVALGIGNGFFALRLVSFLSSLGSFVLLYLMVNKRVSCPFVSFLAMCLFVATFRIAGAWFDIARVDSLFLFLLLASVYAFNGSQLFVRSILSPILMFFAFFTKQTGLVAGLSLSIAALSFRTRYERFLFGIIFGGLAILSVLLMNMVTEGWYGHYIFDLPRGCEMYTHRLVFNFWVDDLLRKVPLAICFGLTYFILVSQKTDLCRYLKTDIFVLAGFLGVSLFARSNPGSNDNVLMPAFAAIILYTGAGFALCIERLKGFSLVKTTLYFALLVQFINFCYMPQKQVPSMEDRRKGEELLQRISQIPGDVLLFGHPWYLKMIDKPTNALEQYVKDIFSHSPSREIKRQLSEEISRSISDAKYDAIILDFKSFPFEVNGFEANYILVDENLCGDSFDLVVGWERKPTFLYVRRPDI